MAVNVNLPPIRVPDSILELLGDEAADYFNKVNFVMYQMWRRQGGANDLIDETQLGELYEPGIQTVDNDELEGFNDDPELNLFDIEERLEEIENIFLSANDLDDRLEFLENEFKDNVDFEDRIESLENELDSGDGLEERVEELENDISFSSVSPEEFEVLTVTASFTTTGNQIIICNNTSAITITLNATPGDGERVYIKRANTGTVSVASSDNIDGSASIAIISRYDCPLVVYTIGVDEWSVI